MASTIIAEPRFKSFKFDLVQMIDDVRSPSGSSDLSSFIRINKRILDYILGVNIVVSRIEPYVNIISAKSVENAVAIHTQSLQDILDIMQKHAAGSSDMEPTVIHFIGGQGFGKDLGTTCLAA